MHTSSRSVPVSFHNRTMMFLTNPGMPQYYFPFKPLLIQFRVCLRMYKITFGSWVKNAHIHADRWIYIYIYIQYIIYNVLYIIYRCLCLSLSLSSIVEPVLFALKKQLSSCDGLSQRRILDPPTQKIGNLFFFRAANTGSLEIDSRVFGDLVVPLLV